MLHTFTEKNYDITRIESAFRNVSFSADKSAKQSLASHLRSLGILQKYLVEKWGEENVKLYWDSTVSIADIKYWKFIFSMGRTASPGIVGSANFPVRQMEKKEHGSVFAI